MILDEAIEFLSVNLPSAPCVKKIVINASFSGVLLESGDMGISMNVRKGTGYNDAGLNNQFKDMIGRNGLTTAFDLEALTDPVARSIRLALINALSQPFMTDDYLKQQTYHVESGGSRYSGGFIKKDDTVAIVGYGGNVRGVSQKAKKVFVTELVPDLFRSTVITENKVEQGPFCAELVQASDAAFVFHQADTVMLTGCALVTNTMEEILEQSKGKKIIVYGCSAGFFPAPLFQRGVSIVSTRRITDAETMVDILSNCAGMVERLFSMASEEVMIRQ